MFESLLNYFKKKKTSESGDGLTYHAMTNQEKKEFLSNDFIERMIRVEQRVAQTFGTKLSYKQTRYYQSLTSGEKHLFDAYTYRAKPAAFLFSVVFVFLILSFLSFRFQLTGAVVADDVLGFIFGMSGFWILLLCVDLFCLWFILKHRKEKKFNKKFDILEDIMLGRYHHQPHTAKSSSLGG